MIPDVMSERPRLATEGSQSESCFRVLYLRQKVAALDATHRGRTDLASYYTEHGETPGRWVGRGLAGVDGLKIGDVVTGEQMRLLFAEGRHPLADTSPGGGRVLALGVPYRPSTGEQPFQA